MRHDRNHVRNAQRGAERCVCTRCHPAQRCIRAVNYEQRRIWSSAKEALDKNALVLERTGEIKERGRVCDCGCGI